MRAVADLASPRRFRPPFSGCRPAVFLAGSIIVLAALAVYQNSFSAAFTFDDDLSIADNPTIRQLWPLGPALSPPQKSGLTVCGRPLLNLSLAVNYAFGGTAVRGYHLLNLAIHSLAGLVLLGIVRRTLLQPGLRERFGAAATLMALAVALLWTVHPLSTEAVTYVIQRAESLMGLFYLLTMYCCIRSMDSETPPTRVWHVLAVAACLLGMATKEVMVSAPLMALLYDRTFVAGTFREAWRRRRQLYLGLAGTWLLLGWLVASEGNRGGTAGFDVGVSWWAYPATQFRAIACYLWLSFWPHPLIFDYGTEWIERAGQIVPYALILLPLVTGTVIALWRRPVLGFAGCWFFAILAPSSLVPGRVQMIVEHRLYLPLAAVIALWVPALYALAGRRSLTACLALAAGLGWLASQRNEDYRSERSLWSDTATKRPGNARAHYNLGVVLAREGRPLEAIAHYEEALRIRPNYADPHNNLGTLFAQMGRFDEAMRHYAKAVRINPADALAQYNLALGLVQAGRVPEAIGHYEEAVRIHPSDAAIHNNLGNAFFRMGRLAEAIEHYEQALRLRPDYEKARQNLAQVRALQQASSPEN